MAERTQIAEWWETHWTWGSGLIVGNSSESRHVTLALAREWLAKLRASKRAAPGSVRLVHVRRYRVATPPRAGKDVSDG